MDLVGQKIAKTGGKAVDSNNSHGFNEMKRGMICTQWLSERVEENVRRKRIQRKREGWKLDVFNSKYIINNGSYYELFNHEKCL